MIKFSWMASNCYATTARHEIFVDKNFVGAPKTMKSMKILALKILGYTVFLYIRIYFYTYVYISIMNYKIL